MSLTAISIGKLVTSVTVLGAAGFAGFNLMTTGCPLGTTCETDKGAAIAEVSTATTEGGCCDLMAAAEVKTVANTEACSEVKDCDEAKECSESNTQLVANTEKADGCCPSEAAATTQLVSQPKAEECETSCATECTEEKAKDCDKPCAGECPKQLVTTDTPNDNG